MKTKIKEFIEYTKEYQEINQYHSIQIDIADTENDQEFMRYLVSISEIIIPEELTSMSRTRTNLTVEEILDKINAKDSLKSGIKINHKPFIKLSEYENWEGGYIEGFVRIHKKNEPDYFIWTYTRMNKLEEILEKYWDKFRFYDY